MTAESILNIFIWCSDSRPAKYEECHKPDVKLDIKLSSMVVRSGSVPLLDDIQSVQNTLPLCLRIQDVNLSS